MEENIKIRIIYRKGSKPITVGSKGTTLQDIAEDCANQLTLQYLKWCNTIGIDLDSKSKKRYQIGQKYLILSRLEVIL